MTNSAYYNEIDPKAAAWLRELIAQGHIAPGEVDERSIIDVRPSELRGFRQCHFFAGIGAWSYALRRAGVPDDAPVWTGSCPCQPFSAAGKGGGVDDERHLWPHFHHLVRECRPAIVLGEQVASKDGLAWFDLVQADLEGTDYAAGAVDTCASGFGAPHLRQRLWWAAYDLRSAANAVDEPDRQRREGQQVCLLGRGSQQGGLEAAGAGGSGDMADAHEPGSQGGNAEHIDAEGRNKAARHSGSCGAVDSVADAAISGLETRPSRSVCQSSAVERSERRRDDAPTVEHASGERRERGQASASRHDDERQAPERSQGQHGAGEPVSYRLPERPGPTNGFWRDADWLRCTDERWRPVEPLHVEMVDGSASSVGCSGEGCGYEGDKKDTLARLQALRDTFGEEEISEQAGNSFSLSEESVLRPDLHGGLDGRPDKNGRDKELSPPIGQDRAAGMRKLRQERHPPFGASRGREPEEQYPAELEDIVRLLPCSLSLAELHGRREDAEKLRILQRSILPDGAMQHSPNALQAAWASLGKNEKVRLGVEVDVARWRVVETFPLVENAVGRVMRLRGYGNAINAEAATAFIEATFEALSEAVADG